MKHIKFNIYTIKNENVYESGNITANLFCTGATFKESRNRIIELTKAYFEVHVLGGKKEVINFDLIKRRTPFSMYFDFFICLVFSSLFHDFGVIKDCFSTEIYSPHYKTKNLKFCKKCKHKDYLMTGWGFNPKAICKHSSNIKEKIYYNWEDVGEKIKYINSPKHLNKNNDCKNYSK